MAIIKSYIGNTQKEAFEKVKAELGYEAVIINTRKIRKKGLHNLLKKPLVEMTAVLDEPNGSSLSANNKFSNESDEELRQFISETAKNEKLSRIEKKIIQVSDAINMVYKDVDLIKNKELAQFQPELTKIIKSLIDASVTQENAIKIINEAKVLISNDEMEPMAAVRKIISGYLGEASPIELPKRSSNTVIFLGPTGVGKTTTLAKIAAVFSLRYNARVGLITEDTYRIGAVEQLKIYADILSIPLEVTYEPGEIKDIISKMEDLDLILIDTAGKSPLDNTYHESLKTLIKESDAGETHLVISSTTDYAAMLLILENYSFIGNYKILFTKIDECDKLGNILNIKMLTKKPLSYITNGQNVADDIFPASANFIISKLFAKGDDCNGSSTST